MVINIFVLPITFGGLLHFPDGSVDPDTFVLTVPIAEGQGVLALFVFIGVLSAATGMVIVATIALTTMVSNDLVMPVLLLLLAGTAEFGRYFYTYSALARATRVSARYLSGRLLNDTEKSIAKNLAVCGLAQTTACADCPSIS